MKRLKLYSCTSFTGVWPVGVAAIIFAENKEQAKVMLEQEIAYIDREQDITLEDLHEVKRELGCTVLVDGEY